MTRCELSEGSVRVRVDVRDTGIGIKAEDHQAIFEPYRQVRAGFNQSAGGTGLGLPIAKYFVEAHNGSVGVQSEPGKGSTFSMELELELCEEPTQPQEVTSLIHENHMHTGNGGATGVQTTHTACPAASPRSSIHVHITGFWHVGAR